MAFQLENPYLDEFESMMPEWRVPPHFRKLTMERYMARQRMVARYAWAIPTTDAIELLLRFTPLIEMGAGTGYWAWLVRQAGGDILAFDRYPPPDRRNRWHAGEPRWTEVLPGGPRRLTRHPGRTLMLCWPPQDDPMAEQCLQVYEGQTLVYIGELEATELDATEVDAEEPLADPGALPRPAHPFEGWAVTEALELPRWESINDRLFVLRRARVDPRQDLGPTG